MPQWITLVGVISNEQYRSNYGISVWWDFHDNGIHNVDSGIPEIHWTDIRNIWFLWQLQSQLDGPNSNGIHTDHFRGYIYLSGTKCQQKYTWQSGGERTMIENIKEQQESKSHAGQNEKLVEVK